MKEKGPERKKEGRKVGREEQRKNPVATFAQLISLSSNHYYFIASLVG